VKFRICAIGCGWMAATGHGPSYRRYSQENPEVELAACCDINEEAARRFRLKFGFAAYYTDIFEMLEKEQPDAVCLTVPVHLTAELAVRIMEAGYPVIMEKPPGLDSKEAMDIINAAEKTGIPNQVAFNRRFTPLVRRLKDHLSKHFKPEEIQNIQYCMYRTGRTDEDFSTTAIHGIDAARFLARSDYRHIRFTYQELPGLGKGVANIYMDCTFESGAAAQLSFCPVAGVTVERATVHLHNHTFFLNIPVWGGFDSPGSLLHFEKDKLVSNVSGLELSSVQELYETNGFYGEDASFFDDIRAGRKPADDVRSALQSVEIAECIRYRKAEYK
jgi:myo-inositol 2-dehydrogenase/D-chiro-inositol 1-dehydrogenase